MSPIARLHSNSIYVKGKTNGRKQILMIGPLNSGAGNFSTFLNLLDIRIKMCFLSNYAPRLILLLMV